MPKIGLMAAQSAELRGLAAGLDAIKLFAAMAIAAALLAGAQTAASAAAGGLVSVVAGLASAFVASRSDAKSAGGILFGALRAEAVKLGIAVLLLWLVLANCAEAVVGVFVAAFIVTMLIFAMAFFVRDY